MSSLPDKSCVVQGKSLEVLLAGSGDSGMLLLLIFLWCWTRPWGWISAYLPSLSCSWGRLGLGNPILCFPSKGRSGNAILTKEIEMFCLLGSQQWSWPVLIILRGFEPAHNLKALNPFHQRLFVVSFSRICHSPARTVYWEAPLHEFMKFTRTMQHALWFPARPLKQFGL